MTMCTFFFFYMSLSFYLMQVEKSTPVNVIKFLISPSLKIYPQLEHAQNFETYIKLLN